MTLEDSAAVYIELVAAAGRTKSARLLRSMSSRKQRRALSEYYVGRRKGLERRVQSPEPDKERSSARSGSRPLALDSRHRQAARATHKFAFKQYGFWQALLLQIALRILLELLRIWFQKWLADGGRESASAFGDRGRGGSASSPAFPRKHWPVP